MHCLIFRKRNTNKIDSFNFPYDYKSIMHYKSITFSRNTKYTITKLDDTVPVDDFGSSVLSKTDIQKINSYISKY